MIDRNRKTRSLRKGVALILAMVFLAVFGAFAAAMASMSSANAESSAQQQDTSNALVNAESGLECAKYLVDTVVLDKTGTNTVSAAEATVAWGKFCTYVQAQAIGGGTVSASTAFTDSSGTGLQMTVAIPATVNSGAMDLRFYKYNNDNTIWTVSTGTDGSATRKIRMSMSIEKENKVLQYAIASRGRMWITGDSTIHGSVYSAWNLSNSQLTQLTSLEEQIVAKLADGTLSSTFSTLVSSLSLTSTNRTTVLNELTSGVLTPDKAAARCIGLMPITSSNTLYSVAPFNMTSDSTVLGSMNTCWTQNQVGPRSWQFETWGAPITLDDGSIYYPPVYQTDGSGDIIYETDGSGNFLLDDNDEKIKARVVNSGDEIQGITAGVNYGEAPADMAGMSIADYDTTTYYNATLTANGGGGSIYAAASPTLCTNFSTLGTTNGTQYRYEYFPHAAQDSGGYTTDRPGGGGLKVKRWIYKNQTFSNARLPDDKNALFINCVFNDVLYVDAGRTTSNYNNVRFDNCTFNGTIVSDTPQSFNWQKNALYFTGSATFQNNTAADATILAPHFNVNLGNSNPVAGTNNVLNGAIVGGIVDVRGNAEVFGTIISMADTSSYSSGYVTNIGATLGDGGSETVEIDDVGTINVTPEPSKKLPSGITTPIVINAQQGSYSEIL